MEKVDCKNCPKPEVCCSQKVKLTAMDINRFKKAGANVEGDTANPNNELCVFFKEGGCSIYHVRPLDCREFVCAIATVFTEKGMEKVINTEVWLADELVLRAA